MRGVLVIISNAGYLSARGGNTFLMSKNRLNIMRIKCVYIHTVQYTVY